MGLIEEREKMQIRFQQTQSEKNYYLGEFKENIIVAIKISELDGNVQEKILFLMRRKDAILLKINRKVSLNNVKKYIKYADEIGLEYRLVDGINFLGDVGMVIVSKEVQQNEKKDVVLENKNQIYIDAGLSPLYAEFEGKKICKKHYDELVEKLPSHVNKFKKINFFDKLIGPRCPIDEELKKGDKN